MKSRRRIAVLGSNSFSGADFVDLLLDDEQNEILGTSRSPEKSGLFLPYTRRPCNNFTFYQLDLNSDVDRLVELLDSFKPQYIVNFAAQSEVAPSWQYPEHWYTTNVVSLAKLTNRLRDRAYLHRYVHISSPEVYGTCEGRVVETAPMNPTTPYAVSKAAADMHLSTLVKAYQFPLITIRSTNVYGPHQQLWKIIPRSAIYLKRGKKIPLHGGGVAVKSYIHIRDVSRGELAAMLTARVGAMYHFSPDQGYQVRDVVREVCECMGRDFNDSVNVVGERLGQDAAYIIDSSSARNELGWSPTVSLSEGVSQVVNWITENWVHIQDEPLDYVHEA